MGYDDGQSVYKLKRLSFQKESNEEEFVKGKDAAVWRPTFDSRRITHGFTSLTPQILLKNKIEGIKSEISNPEKQTNHQMTID